MRMLKKLTPILLSTCLLGGCILDPVKPTVIKSYEIKPDNSLNTNATFTPKFDYALILAPMISTSPYNSVSMYYSEKNYEISAYSFSEWATSPAFMINNSVLFTLSSKGPFKATADAVVITYAQYRLNLTLNSIVLNLYTKEPHVSLNVSAQLTDIITGRLVSKHNFDIDEPSKVSPEGFVIAANKATDKLSEEVYQWLSEQSLPKPSKTKIKNNSNTISPSIPLPKAPVTSSGS
jgi:ABC-type uncharacterized transport system auxiliary subunit